MSKFKSDFPPVGRIVVLLLCSSLIIGICVQIASPKFRQELDIANVFVYFVCVMISCFGIWLSLFAKKYTLDELAAMKTVSTPKFPEVSEHAIECRFQVFNKTAAIFLDTVSGQIYFEGCHVPRKLLTSTQSWYSCPITDVKATHMCRNEVFRNEGKRMRFSREGEDQSLFIVTASGTASIPSSANNFAQLRDKLKEIVPYNQPGFSIDHPMMSMVYLAGAVFGLFAGWALTPNSASDSTLGLFVLCGAILGVATGHVLVLIADRNLKIGLTQPIGFGTVGAIVGLVVHRPFAPIVGWNAGMAYMVVGSLIGCVFGIIMHNRERDPSIVQSEKDLIEKN